MNPRTYTHKTIRFLAVVAAVTSLTACQKTRNSSVNRAAQQSALPANPQTPYVPPVRPGVPVPPRPVGPGPGPGVFVPPGIYVPPGDGIPGTVVPPGVNPGGPVVVPPIYIPPTAADPVVPPRATPPTVVPPTVTPPTVVPPAIPTTPDEPVVTPLPTPPQPVPPVVYVPPLATPPYVPAPVVGGPSIIVTGGGTGGSIQVGPGAGAYVTTNVMAGDVPVILNGLRVQTPVRSEIMRTCHGAKCQETTIIFSHECGRGKDCGITTEEVVKKPVLTCPDIELRARPYTNKLDILFVVDTSASMREERVEIARQMTKFIGELSFDVEYRIAVLLGHGPRSETGRVGDLFTPPSMATTYGVIQMNDILEAKRAQLGADKRATAGRSGGLSGDELEKRARAEAAQTAADRLAEMMLKVPNDSSEAQGEAGLLNLYSAVSDSRNLAEMKRRGFWNDNAAKAVVFIADENDVCFDYAEASRASGQTIKGRYATEGDRKAETTAFAAQDVCRSTANGSRLTPKRVFDAVEASSTMPVIFAGILYLDNKSIPAKPDKYSKDNEMGHGYLDVIAFGQGKAIDLGQANFGTTLAKIGDFANFKMKYDHIFPMTNVKDVTDIDPNSINVLIVDPSGQQHVFNAANVRLEIDAATNQARVIIAYEVLAKVYADGKVVQGSKVRINYSTKSGKGEATAKDEKVGQAIPAKQQTKRVRIILNDGSDGLPPVEDLSVRADSEEIARDFKIIREENEAKARAAEEKKRKLEEERLERQRMLDMYGG